MTNDVIFIFHVHHIMMFLPQENAEVECVHVAAINPGALFGLITFSHKIGLYDVQGPIPVVKYVSIPPDMDGKLPVDLDMAMPLPAFLAPVCSFFCLLPTLLAFHFILIACIIYSYLTKVEASFV